MILIKNRLLISILLINLIFPLGGVGLSGIQNFLSTSGADSEINNLVELSLSFDSNGSESGFSPFIYFDALPYDLAIQYNREYRFTPLNSTLVLTDALGASQINEFESIVVRVSDYFTIRKEMVSLSALSFSEINS